MTNALRHLSIRPTRSRNPVSGPRRTDGQGFFFPLALNCRRCCSGNFRIGGWEILGYGFQNMVFKTWDLNFGAWIFTLAVSKIETWKLLGRDLQDVGSQFWDLDFTQGLQSDLRPRAPTSMYYNIYNIVPQKHWHLGIWQTYNSNVAWYIKNWRQMIWLTSIKLQTKSLMLLTQELPIEKCNKHVY
jgi:hypothetical protein